MTLSLRCLRLANRIRQRLGRPALPKRCCRKPQNLGEPEATDNAALTFRRCIVCGARHFRLNAETAFVGARTR